MSRAAARRLLGVAKGAKEAEVRSAPRLVVSVPATLDQMTTQAARAVERAHADGICLQTVRLALVKAAKMAKMLFRDDARCRALEEAVSEAQRWGVTDFPPVIRKVMAKVDCIKKHHEVAPNLEVL